MTIHEIGARLRVVDEHEKIFGPKAVQQLCGYLNIVVGPDRPYSFIQFAKVFYQTLVEDVTKNMMPNGTYLSPQLWEAIPHPSPDAGQKTF